MKQEFKCILAGALAGTVNGLLGAGGGVFLVPLLIGWIGLEEKEAFATSVAVMLPIAAVSFTVFCLRGGSVWTDAFPYFIGGAVGGIFSARFLKSIPTHWLHRAFGVLILYSGVKAVFFP